MKTRTNQPVFYDNGQKVDDSALGGTKLYLHHIIDKQMAYIFDLISTFENPIDFSTLDTQQKIWDYIKNYPIISFREKTTDFLVVYGIFKKHFFGIGVDDESVTTTFYDDWDLSKTTDEVTPL